MVKKNIKKSFLFLFSKISNNTTIYNYNTTTTIQPQQYNQQQQYNYNQQQYTITMQQQDNLPPRISDSHFIHTQTVTCTTKHFGNDMIL